MALGSKERDTHNMAGAQWTDIQKGDDSGSVNDLGGGDGAPYDSAKETGFGEHT